MWSKTQEFPSPEQPIVFQQPTQPLVDQVVEPISDLVDPTLLSESDPYVIERMSPLVSLTLPSKSEFHEAVESISVSINPTLPLESEVSTSHIFFLPVQILLNKGALNLLRINPHQALRFLPLIGTT